MFYSLIQAQLGCIPIQEFALTQDMAKIFKCGVRVTKCKQKQNVAFCTVYCLQFFPNC